jgi:hypothetical protein
MYCDIFNLLQAMLKIMSPSIGEQRQKDTVSMILSHKDEFMSSVESGHADDPLVELRWCDAGLTARVPLAAALGLTTPLGALVADAGNLRDAIVNLLCAAPNPGRDLGHATLFEFRPHAIWTNKIAQLIMGYTWLRCHALGYSPPPANSAAIAAMVGSHGWPDIVEYTQECTIVGSNKPILVADAPHYFNV